MPVILSDFDPGTLTGFFIVMLFGLVVMGCLVAAGVAFWAKKQQAVRGLLTASGISFAIGVLLFILALSFGKTFHLL